MKMAREEVSEITRRETEDAYLRTQEEGLWRRKCEDEKTLRLVIVY